MIIQLQMGPEFNRTVAELGGMGKALVAAVSAGLDKGTKAAAGRVGSDYLSGQALRSRTGNLRRAVDAWLTKPLEAVIGVRPNSAVAKYAWLLGDEDRTITPKRGKFLAIPIGENLTGAGVARFTSPRQVPDGFFVRTGGRLLFGYKKGKRGKFRALFTLVTSVFVQGSGALRNGVLDSLDDISGSIESEIGSKLNA